MTRSVRTGSTYLPGKPLEEARSHGLGLIEFCERCETIELWIDPEPNAQLTLIWLLDYLRPHAEHRFEADFGPGGRPSSATIRPEEVAAWRLPAVKIRNDHLETASSAWQAYRAPTPQDWFDLLGDGSRAPCRSFGRPSWCCSKNSPCAATGLGATEMRMLELISAGDARPSDVFPGHEKPNQRRVFGYWEVGALLDGLARCPAPAVSGLDEGPFTLEMHDDRERHERYKRSKLALTALGQAILAGREDFSRHNPIHRWWGGTELTNDRLWRWDRNQR